MSGRELVVLGTASLTPTRGRAQNAWALQWDDQLLLFDPGEGTQRQSMLAGVHIARLTGVFITHFHGDHCLGLPGVIQRHSLDNSLNPGGGAVATPLPIWFPAEGGVYLERLRTSTDFTDHSDMVAVPVSDDGPAGAAGALQVTARRLEHRVPTVGYRLQEPDAWHVDPDLAAAAGVVGPLVGEVLREGRVEVDGRVVRRDEIASLRPGHSFAFVMDTRLCDGAVELARDVDMLVIESTYLHRDRELAEAYDHLTARQAAELATEVGARRLVLGHFSSRYPDASVFGDEARRYHDDVVVGSDLARIQMPPRR